MLGRRQWLCSRASGTKKHRGPNNCGRSPWYSCLPETALEQGENDSITAGRTAEDRGGGTREARKRERGRGGKNADVAFVKLPHLIIDVCRTAENNLSGKVSQKLHRFLPPLKWLLNLWRVSNKRINVFCKYLQILLVRRPIIYHKMSDGE